MSSENHALDAWFSVAYSDEFDKALLSVKIMRSAKTHYNRKEVIMNNDLSRLAHTTWNCKYHIVFAPKYRRKVFYGSKRQEIVSILKELCRWKGIEIIEGEACPDHIHLLVSIPPKMSVGSVVRIIKSNTARDLKKQYPFLKKYYFGTQSVWSDGYFVSTV